MASTANKPKAKRKAKAAAETRADVAAFRAMLARAGYTYTADGEATDVIYRGNVYLPSLTALPENATFSNGGYVDLRITALPENTTFSNGGNVYLPSLTALPENATFSNGGNVELRSLTEETQAYRGQQIRLRHIDGFTMLISRERKRGDITIASARYFGGGEIKALRKCFVASEGDYHAHGETVENALQDLRFKVVAVDFDFEDTIAEIRRTGVVERYQFRLLTGACDEGLRAGLEQAGQPGGAEKLPIAVALAAAHGSYGALFKALIGGAA